MKIGKLDLFEDSSINPKPSMMRRRFGGWKMPKRKGIVIALANYANFLPPAIFSSGAKKPLRFFFHF